MTGPGPGSTGRRRPALAVMPLLLVAAVGAAAAATGNPFHDHFAPHRPGRGKLLPPPASPTLYRGVDFQSDELAMLENGFVLLAVSLVEGDGADFRQVVEQGRLIGAAAVIAYGRPFDDSSGQGIRMLPFRPNVPGQVATAGIGEAMIAAPAQPTAASCSASYWGKVQPTVLGVLLRPLDPQEAKRWSRRYGAVVEAVVNCTSAQAANILRGDILLAIDGKPVRDLAAIDPFIDSIAGKKVRIDLLRQGAPLSIEVQVSQKP